MKASHHQLLANVDLARTVAHQEALAEWRAGPFTDWLKASKEAEIKREAIPTKPPAPAAPVSVQHTLLNIASVYGLTVDDLVRHTRGTEVRTSYPAGALDRARDDLGPDLASLLGAVAWPELSPLPAPPAPPPHPEPEVAAAAAAAEPDPEGDTVDVPKDPAS